MKIAILGYGLQGASALRYWCGLGHDVTVCDVSPDIEVPSGVTTKLGPDYLTGLDDYDLLVRTPILRPEAITAANPDTPNILDKVTSVTNEFMRVCPTRNIIGVTGTKGKGTTSSLIAGILEAAGHRVHLGGNIGTPPLDLLADDITADDWVVLELANFQLIDLKYSPKVAVCLMVVPEHMDWHLNVPEYAEAKQQIFRYQTADDLAVFNRANAHSTDIASITKAKKVSYEVPGPGAGPSQTTGAYVDGDTIYMDGQAVCQISDVSLMGRHNLENVCAAIAATWEIVEHNAAVIKAAVSNFKGLEHRLELVRELDGVKYYDDSFGTTPETAMVALQAFDQPVVVILGGSDKGASYDELAQVVVSRNVRAAILIGATAPEIEKALRQAGFDHIFDGGKTMNSIVQTARHNSQSGDVVLLSTGCASFGMFDNYKDRGDQFKQAVQSLV